MKSLTPEKVIAYTWLSVALCCCWPLSPNCTKFQIFGFKILRVLAMISVTLLILPLAYSIYLHVDDFMIIAKSSCLVIAGLQVLVQTTISATQYDRFQRLIEEMKFCCKHGEPHEKHVFQQYVEKYSAFYGFAMGWFYLSAFVFNLSTLVLPQPLPIEAEYPFAVDYQPIYTLIFLHQFFFGIQCAAHICMNIFCALLLWFAAARFEIVRLELKAVSNIQILIKCIRKLQHVQRYAKEVTTTVRFIAMITLSMSTAALMSCGITLLSKQLFGIQMQFVFLGVVALLEVYLCAWPADHLMQVSANAVCGIYDSAWYEQTANVRKMILYLLTPQKPISVSISVFIPALSMEYYSAYLSNTFSAFTALRVMLDAD